MLHENKLPERRVDYPAFLQNEYAMLRAVYDPATACRVLSEQYEMSAEVIRRFIGMKSAVRICRDCWMEYVHDYMASTHRCRACVREVNLLGREVLRGPADGFRGKADSRYMSDQKRIERAVRLLVDDHGLSEAEALKLIGDIQERERLNVKNESGYSNEA